MLAPILSAAGSALSSGLGFLSNLWANKQNKELAQYSAQQNQLLQDRAFAQNKQMWSEQNAYNSPTAQMARLKSAGLNPNLVYGNGSVGNSSGSAPKMEAASYPTPKMEPYNGWNLGLADSIALSMRNKELQSNLQTQDVNRQLLKQKAISEGLRQAGQTIANSRSGISLKFAEELQKTALEKAKTNIENMRYSGALTQNKANGESIKNEILQATKDLKVRLTQLQFEKLKMSIQKLSQDMDINAYQLRLRKSGVTDHDNILIRVGMRAASGLFGDDFVDRSVDWIFEP